MASRTPNSWSSWLYEAVGAIPSETANSQFQAFYEHIRIRELQEEISDSTPEWLTSRPPRTAPIILEYDTQVPVSIKDWKTLEACNVGIHEALCYVEEKSRTEMHYYLKATKRPGKRDLLHTPFHRGSPEGTSLSTGFPVFWRFQRGPGTTGRQMPAVEDATTWRLKWFKQHIALASWPFFLASYRHQRLKFNNQTQKFMNDREVEERGQMKGEKEQVPEVDSNVDSSKFFYKRRDSPLGRHYDLQFLPGNAHYGP
ncbi:uncharacterized protein APUU_71163A [Aspergillus puulaauensis]|uniref:Uncharacterized protein n=1 Tax=Aspergillus puulaauensis TaxID=1220207 RepID=A0A7R7XZ44_9EURO|nr:uncharacterized protein APUU_71163A [Aspergillus puulaauensis]BCS29593.1 hypothetical protein APUU_71163A [Aspergillus puulaauensis]